MQTPPDEVPGQVDVAEVPQVRPSSRDSIWFLLRMKDSVWVGCFFSMNKYLAFVSFVRWCPQVPGCPRAPGRPKPGSSLTPVAHGAQNPFLEGKTLISRRSG